MRENTYETAPGATAAQNGQIHTLADAVSSAVRNVGTAVDVAGDYDRDISTEDRLGHLLEASGCLETAMTHLGRLLKAMSDRLAVEDRLRWAAPPAPRPGPREF